MKKEITGCFVGIIRHGPKHTTRIVLEVEPGKYIDGLISNADRNKHKLDNKEILHKPITVKIDDIHDPAKPEYLANVLENPNLKGNKIDVSLLADDEFLQMESIDEKTNTITSKFTEGNKEIVQHIVYERNYSIIKKIKGEREWKCDICTTIPEVIYGVSFIEAHHKIMISVPGEEHEVKEEDIVLLCPNCHTATHHLMRQNKEYGEIKETLQLKWEREGD